MLASSRCPAAWAPAPASRRASRSSPHPTRCASWTLARDDGAAPARAPRKGTPQRRVVLLTDPARMKKNQMILVVDDEKTIADGLRLTLESEGYGVRTAGSLPEALGAV